MEDETITISQKEYDMLKKESEYMAALQKYGVDNWDGYDDAINSVNHP